MRMSDCNLPKCPLVGPTNKPKQRHPIPTDADVIRSCALSLFSGQTSTTKTKKQKQKPKPSNFVVAPNAVFQKSLHLPQLKHVFLLSLTCLHCSFFNPPSPACLPFHVIFSLTPQSTNSQKSTLLITMYPKVKVREERNQDYEDVAVDHNIKIDSLSLHVSSSPETEHQEVTPPFIARIPVCYATTDVVTPAISARKETEKNDVKIEVKDRPNIRATPNLRPRAVLSSPDNDAVIGNKNRIKTERPTALRNRNSVQNRHSNAQCKVLPSHINAKGQINTNLSNDTTTIDNKSELKEKKGSTMTVPSQRRYIRSGKSDPVKT